MELKWSTPRTESKAASLNFEIKNEETFCFRDIVDELEEGETDLEASLKEAYRYSWIYHPTVCNESNPTFSGKHLTWSMLTVPEALTGETIFHFCSSSFEFLSIFIVSGRSWLPGSTFVGPRSTFQESQVCFLNAITGSN